MKAFFLLTSLLFASFAHAYQLRSGTYQMSGGNGGWLDSSYHGEVIIQPQGDNYSLRWKIGMSQSQVGVGILHRDILSVAYLDQATGIFGVASYRLITDGELEGIWSSFNGTSQKPEYLVWKSYFTY